MLCLKVLKLLSRGCVWLVILVLIMMGVVEMVVLLVWLMISVWR